MSDEGGEQLLVQDHTLCYASKAHDHTSYDQWLCQEERAKCKHEFRTTLDPERVACRHRLVFKLV